MKLSLVLLLYTILIEKEIINLVSCNPINDDPSGQQGKSFGRSKNKFEQSIHSFKYKGSWKTNTEDRIDGLLEENYGTIYAIIDESPFVDETNVNRMSYYVNKNKKNKEKETN